MRGEKGEVLEEMDDLLAYFAVGNRHGSTRTYDFLRLAWAPCDIPPLAHKTTENDAFKNRITELVLPEIPNRPLGPSG